MLWRHFIQRFKDAVFDGHVFNSCFDDDIHIMSILKIKRRCNASKDLILFFFRHAAFFNIAGQVLGDGPDSALVCFLLHVIQFHVQSCLCANLRDAGTHLSGANDHYVLNRHAYFASLGTSIMIASPCPPPEQMAAMPMPPPRRFNSYANVRIMRAPLAPIGCPSATDPPLTFTFSASKSAIFELASATAANASL